MWVQCEECGRIYFKGGKEDICPDCACEEYIGVKEEPDID